MTTPEPEVMALETHVNETVERLRVRDSEVSTRSQVTVDWNRLRHLIGYNENRYTALTQQLAAAEAELQATAIARDIATQREEHFHTLNAELRNANATLTRERDAAQAQVARLEREGDRDIALWDAVNSLSLCHQCQPELENALAEAGEEWDAGNPEPDAAFPTPTPQPEATNGAH